MKKLKIQKGCSFIYDKKTSCTLESELNKLAKHFISKSISYCNSLEEILQKFKHEDLYLTLTQCSEAKYLQIKEKNTHRTIALLGISELAFSSCSTKDLLLVEQAFHMSISSKSIIYLAEEDSLLLRKKIFHKELLKIIGSVNMNKNVGNDFPEGLLKNTNFLGKAIDITKIDPAAVSSSLTGINALNFDVTKENAVPTSDGRFGIPPGTKFEPIFSTDVSLNTVIFEENTNIYNKFSFSLSIGDFEGEDSIAQDAAFSDSSTCDFINENTAENKNTVTYSNATHKLYILRQNIAYNSKKLIVDDEFQFWITKKLDPQNPTTFNNFINNVGTHYITSVLYGGLGYQVLKIDSQSLSQLKEKHISISAAAQEIMLHATATHDQKETYSSFSQSITSKTVFIGGTVLPHFSEDRTLDFTDWSESVINEPAAISIEVSRISNLLTPDYFHKIDPSLLEQIRQGLDQAITHYLKTHRRSTPKTAKVIMIQDPSQSVGFVQNESPHKAISGFYTQFWKTDTFAFSMIRENSPTKFYIASPTNRHTRPLLHGSEVFIVYNDAPSLPNEDLKKFLSWYSTYPQAYFDSTVDNNGYIWIIEKVNRNIDDTIREKDIVRIRKNVIGIPEYISTTALNDGNFTLTWTRDLKNAEFSIKTII